jgi:hypothetical protein
MVINKESARLCNDLKIYLYIDQYYHNDILIRSNQGSNFEYFLRMFSSEKDIILPAYSIFQLQQFLFNSGLLVTFASVSSLENNEKIVKYDYYIKYTKDADRIINSRVYLFNTPWDALQKGIEEALTIYKNSLT